MNEDEIGMNPNADSPESELVNQLRADLGINAEDIAHLEKLVAEDPRRAAAEIKRLRREAQSRRQDSEELRRLKKEAEAEAARKQQEREAALREQGEWKTLAEQREQEKAELARKLEALADEKKAIEKEREENKRYLEAITQMLEERKAAIPKGMEKRLPPIDDPLELLRWIDANADLFQERRAAPALNQGTATVSREAIKKEVAEASQKAAAERIRSMF